MSTIEQRAKLLNAGSVTADGALHEAAPSESQRMLGTLMSNLPGMAYRCKNTPEFTMIFVSDGCLELTGYTAEQLTGNAALAYSAMTHPDDLQMIWDTIQQAISETRHFELHYRIITRGGEEKYVWERGLGVYSPEGEFLFIEGFVTDITQRRKAEKQVEAQAALLDKAQDAILVAGLDHRIRYWNKSAERVFGWTAQESLGRRMEDLFYKAEPPAGFEGATKVVLEKRDWSGELTKRTRSGREVIVESRWTLVGDEKGRPQSILIIDTDVTERKKLEAQFLRAQRMESIGTLAGGIAHDLNNVLAPIMMSLAILRSRAKDRVDVELVRTLETSTKRAADMVKQVLSFARGFEGTRVLVNPKQIVADVEQLMRETFPKSISASTSVEACIHPVSCDPTQIHQVLLNLCVNARDAMPEGGRLTIRATNSSINESDVTEHPGAKPGPCIVLQVNDTGSGIPTEVRERIFEPFFTTKDVGAGTGLGLSTSLAIVKGHGGFITLRSEAGRGSSFNVFLPAQPEMARTPAPQRALPLPHGRGETILVVDDEASIRTITTRTLQAFGYHALSAADGAQALAIYSDKRHEIAAVLTDMMMPVLDGAATIQALMAMNPKVRVIAASGLGPTGPAAKAKDLGVRHFLPKPYNAETLLKTLRSLLDADVTTQVL